MFLNQVNNNDYIIVNNVRIAIKPYFIGGYDRNLLRLNPYIPAILKNNFVSNIILYTKLDDDYVIISGHYMLNSLLKYINGEYCINRKYFNDLTDDKKNLILNTQFDFAYYEPNEFGVFHIYSFIQQKYPNFYTKQEQYNVLMKGKWLEHLLNVFASKDSEYYDIINKYISGSVERSQKLHNCLKMICGNTPILEYMACNRNNENADETIREILIRIYWMDSLFGDIVQDCRLLKDANIGFLYDKYHMYSYDKEIIKKRLSRALEFNREPAFKTSGIFEYALQKHDGKQSIYKRFFAPSTIVSKYLNNNICPICGKPILSLEDAEGDHIIPWISGGLTEESNCQVVHKMCNRRKGVKC